MAKGRIAEAGSLAHLEVQILQAQGTMEGLMSKVLIIVLTFLYWSGFAQAQELPCAEHKAIAATLLHQWGEVLSVQAITEAGDLMEIFTSPGNTWTVVVTFPNGVSCIVATGHDFELLPMPKPPLSET